MKHFLRISWLDFKSLRSIFSAEEFILLYIGYPIVSMIFYVLLAAYSFNTASLTHWIVGNSFLLCINTCIFVMGQSIYNERASGRLRNVIASPTNWFIYLLSKGLFPIAVAFITVLFGFFVGSMLFHVSLAHIDWFPLLLCIVMGMSSATAFGLLLSTFSLVTDSMHFVLNFVATGLLILTGANFPLSQLGPIWRAVSALLPMTHAIAAANRVMANRNYTICSMLLIEALLTILYLVMAALVIRICEYVARKRATLELF